MLLLPAVLGLLCLGHAATALSPKLDLSDAAVLEAFEREWMQTAQRVPTEALQPCPASCSTAGRDPGDWDLYPNAARMAVCNETVLFSMNVDTDLPPAALRVCTADFAETAPSNGSLPGGALGGDEACAPPLEAEQSLPLRLLSNNSNVAPTRRADTASVVSALRQLSKHVANTAPSCNNNAIAFAQSGAAVVGLYVGAQVHRQGISTDVLNRVLSHVESRGSSDSASLTVELCDPNAEYGADYVVGLAINTGGDVQQVQQSVRNWSKGSCLSAASPGDVLGDELSFFAPAPALLAEGPATNGSTSNNSTLQARSIRGVSRRQNYCSNSKTVVDKDTCETIADKRCTISIDNFFKYNPSIDKECKNLKVGQKICCTPGAVPPPDPVPDPVPTAVPYCTNWKAVAAGQTCEYIADKRCTVSLSTFRSRNPQLNCGGSGPKEGQTFCCNEGRVPPAHECSNSKMVVDKDTCETIANKRCTISLAKFIEYNPQLVCNGLKVGEPFCCNEGRVPGGPNADGTCKTASVATGDECKTLASKCGIHGDYIAEFNPKAGFCSTLRRGQVYCCSRGNLPNLRPKKNADGSCFVYTVQDDDDCPSIAARHQLTDDELAKFNAKTWGWNGCSPLWTKTKICLSEGTPPLPASVSNAVCGPTVPGTTRPTDGTPLAELNPCPLNVCCNHWGQCGLNQDFCAITKSKTGAPGTTTCISNCGNEIIRSNPPPASQIRIAYFGAWNGNRPCLNMRVDQIDKSKYTHIHFAFADITPGTFQVDVSKVQHQFDIFKTMTGIKRIISFGGWDFSALPATYRILRDAVKKENRDRFRNNLLKFVEDHGLDGLDLDWEYPGAPDIPDIPKADPQEGLDYAILLGSLRQLLPAHKTVSFAAPASYWYLRAFPIEMLAQYVDYVVFMTYDFHGQWDVGNKWTMEGCPAGNCLRSHVNYTQTVSALSMITKAGMPSSKVIVGVTSYGRSFRMAQPGCVGPMCTFTGTNRTSQASSGRCTEVSGYISDAEIGEIIKSNPSARTWTEELSDYLVYNNTDWVAYMSPANKAIRETIYEMMAMGGSTDWAVDLQSFNGGVDSANAVYIGAQVYDQKKVQCQPPCTLVLPPVRLASDTVISIPPYTTSLEVGSSVGGSFVVTTTTITVVVAPITTREIHQSNVEVKVGQTGGFIPTPSVLVPRPVYTVTNGQGVATARTLTLPPWPAIINGPPNKWASRPGPWVANPTSQAGTSGGPFTMVTTVVAGAPTTRVVTWSTPPSSVVTCPPSTFALQNPATTLTLGSCTGRATIRWSCPPATTVTFAAPSTATLTARCTPFVTAQASNTPTTPTPPRTTPPIVLPCYNGMRKHYIDEYDAVITLSKCPSSNRTTLDRNCGTPTSTVRIEADPSKRFSLGCTLFTGTGTRLASDAPLPTRTTWDGELRWRSKDEIDDVDEEGRSGCDLWFFDSCLEEGGEWDWDFPPGVYPVGPPPASKIIWPPGVIRPPETIFPGVWPPITIRHDKIPVYPVLKPTASCTTRTADICSTTTTLDITTVGGTRTTSTRTRSTCDTIRGCRVDDDDWETTTTMSCSTTIARRGVATADANPTSTPEPALQRRAAKHCYWDDIIIYPQDFKILPRLRRLLQSTNPEDPSKTWYGSGTKVVDVGGEDEFVAFIYIPSVKRNIWMDWVSRQSELGIRRIRSIYLFNRYDEEHAPPQAVLPRKTYSSGASQGNKTLRARAHEVQVSPYRWDWSLTSIPEGMGVNDGYHSEDANGRSRWATRFHDSRCKGQNIYFVEKGIDTTHEVSRSLFIVTRGASA
ncbi:hypothetical protein QBC34DRAFT_340767 [Podospora aff. communis PSN243]|uniref:chitinase n=1 Tax=Podospora aff. communis PSN243 TaxID=3040156 RepID=A0AAV9H3V2_9PEZI|nr:hypothetical protein QBC34DRAFT_340767 [Podospora aff. communis PSN243]